METMNKEPIAKLITQIVNQKATNLVAATAAKLVQAMVIINLAAIIKPIAKVEKVIKKVAVVNNLKRLNKGSQRV